MKIQTIIPDGSIPAWQFRVDQFNAGSGQPPTTIAEFAQTNRDIETAGYVDAYTRARLEKLAPKGLQYDAAPPDVQKQVDELLAPYEPVAS